MDGLSFKGDPIMAVVRAEIFPLLKALTFPRLHKD